MGNDSDQNVQQLKNARADAKAIAVELKARWDSTSRSSRT
jgi:hypothetical protein